MNTEDFKRKLTAILSADVVGYSRLMGDDEPATVRTLNKYKEMIFGLIERHNGRLVDSPGDNLLAEFTSVVDAVRCAVQIQEDLKENNEGLPPNRKMEFRIGINTGDVIQDGDRIYGDGVNVAARIESLADPGGICISRTAYDQVKNKLNIDYEYLGEYEPKNIKDPVRVYRIRMEPEAATPKAPVVSDVKERQKTIAVLPFLNLSSDPEQEYFVDGLSEEILNSLCQIPDLTVIARTSSFSFKGSNKKIQEIANELGVENILEGSVRKAGNALRITAQLVKAVDSFHLWSKTYDRELKDIFAVQEDIANAVAGELKVTLGIGKSFKQLGGTDNPKAYELYLIAKGQYNKLITKGPYDKFIEELALKSLDSAIALDSEFALAWASKSIIHTWLLISGPANRAAAELNAAIHAAQNAIELEPNMAAGYYALGYAKSNGGDFIGSRLAYSNALELTDEPPSFVQPVVPIHYIVVGYFERANKLLEEMLITDPLNYASRGWYMFSFIILGDTQRAWEENEHIRVLLYEGQQGDFIIPYVHLWTGNIVTRDEIDSFDTMWGFPDLIFKAAMEHLDSPKEAIEIIRRIYADKKNLSSWQLLNIAWWSTYFADLEFAMEALEESIRITPENIYTFYFPLMKEIRQMPRFKEFIREIGLVDYWNEFGWPDICRPLNNGDFECD